MRRFILFFAVVLPLSFLNAAPGGDGAAHGGKSGAGDGEVAAAGEEPVKTVVAKVKNPVALDLDEDGNVFVVETVRYLGKGNIDNRGKQKREFADQRIKTMADREAVLRELHEAGDIKTGDKSLAEFFTEHKENVWKFSDPDGDGTFEREQLFYSGFNGFHSGIVAGVMARDGKVYVTAEPELWVFDDRDGTAANGKILHTGFAVKIGWYGHDLHGLVYGNDGRIYFSLADKGWHVTTPEGKVLAHDNTGGVFRCWPDGSELEEYAVGLRNPQELAFDAYGNLFSGDNNCDAGDKARLVYVTEGSDHGWRFSHQSLRSRGPWMREKMWELRIGKDEYLQPAWIVPPIDHIGSGPSGITFYPGVGMPERYRDHFLICDFRGGRGNLDSFAVEPAGAGFAMVDFHHVISGPANSSVRVGYDGKLYVADWGGGWQLNDRGNIFTLAYPSEVNKPAVTALSKLSREDFAAKSLDDLLALLTHADARIRQRAHFAVAARGAEAIAPLRSLASADNVFARLHAVWALGMIARKSPAAAAALPGFLADAHAEVRGQAAVTIGDVGYGGAVEPLMRATRDDSLRVQAFALKALAKLKHVPAVAEAVRILAENDNDDAYLRDACVFALHQLYAEAKPSSLLAAKQAAVRLGAVLAMRRAADPAVAKALSDASPLVVTEAVRAIYDQRIQAALPALAAMLDAELPPALIVEPVLRRAVQANLYLGGTAGAKRLVAFAANGNYPDEHRLAAIEALILWDTPPQREGVWGSWWDVKSATAGTAKAAITAGIDGLLASAGGELLAKGYQLARVNRIEIPPVAYLTAIKDKHSASQVRREALAALAATPHRDDAIDAAFQHGDTALKNQALSLLAESKPNAAFDAITKVLGGNDLQLKQHAIRTLPNLKSAAAQAKLTAFAERLVAGKLPNNLVLDVIEAANSAPTSPAAKIVTAYQATLPAAPAGEKYAFAVAGGNAKAGEQVFQNHAAAQCLRCHKMGRNGGDVGPNLTKIGQQFDADYLLRALVDPGAEIANGYGLVTVTTKAGKIITGTLMNESPKMLTIKVEKQVHKIKADAVANRSKLVSGMPPMGMLLQPGELRDLVAYLKTRK